MATPSTYLSNPLDMIRPSWEGVQLNLKSYLLAFGFSILLFALLALPVVITLVVFASTLAGSINPVSILLLSLFVLAVLLITLYLSTVFYRLNMSAANQERASLRAALRFDIGLIGRLLLTQFLGGLAIVLGLLLFIIPGLILIGWFALAPYAVVAENLSGIAALKRSRELVRGHFVEIWGLIGFTSAIGILNLVPIIGGILVIIATIVLLPVVALRFLQLRDLKAAGDDPKPKVSPWNYAFIVLGVIGAFVGNSYEDKKPGLNGSDNRSPFDYTE